MRGCVFVRIRNLTIAWNCINSYYWMLSIPPAVCCRADGELSGRRDLQPSPDIYWLIGIRLKIWIDDACELVLPPARVRLRARIDSSQVRYYRIDVVGTNKRRQSMALVRMQHIILKTNQYISALADDKRSVDSIFFVAFDVDSVVAAVRRYASRHPPSFSSSSSLLFRHPIATVCNANIFWFRRITFHSFRSASAFATRVAFLSHRHEFECALRCNTLGQFESVCSAGDLSCAPWFRSIDR